MSIFSFSTPWHCRLKGDRERARRREGGMDGEKRMRTRERKGSIKKSNYFDEGKWGVGEGWGAD